MHTEVYNAVTAADQGTQYDESAKRLLGQKSILAQILVRTVDEFKGMNPRYVETLIEGEPYISRIPLEPGLTNQEAMRTGQTGTNVEIEKERLTAGKVKQNISRKEKLKSGSRIAGLNTENQEHAEGLVRFDIVFYVRMEDGLSQIIINVEAQKDEPQRYGILNRAVFYVSRLISSQKERDFENTEYDDIKRVYSIWVCMNMEENSLSHIHLVKDDLVGYHDWRGKLDLFNIVMIGLAKKLPGQGGYSCAAEPPVQYRLSHLSRRSEPLIKHTICMMRVYSRNALSNPYTSRMEISCSASMLVMLMR